VNVHIRAAEVGKPVTTQQSSTRAPNIRDVARAAGVSYQTVSRVLNDSPNLRAATRQRVLDAIDALGYRPNQAARALVTSRSGIIGVLVAARFAAYGVQTILYEVEDAAREAGYRVQIVTCQSDDGSVQEGIDQLADQAAEAIVVVAPQARVFDRLAASPARVPFVMLDSERRDEGHSISVDQYEGARLATRHLIELGHRRIIHLAGPQDWIEADARMRGYLREVAENELIVPPPVLGEWTAEFGYQAGRELMNREHFTAVFCSNDQMALGLLHAFREAGLRVPADVSVVGFDDIPEAAHFWPPLTTIRQDFAEIGRRAIGSLLTALTGEDAGASHEAIRPQLVLRSSTGAPGVGSEP
jgi:DNA-binding LacI/PurR family transcriptional regulator